MKLVKRSLFIAALFAMSSGIAFAATDTVAHDVDINVLEVVLIGLNDGTAITLNTVAPGAAGANPTGQTDASKEVRYTSLVAGSTRKIQANYGATAPPAGTGLDLEASSVPAGCGNPVAGGVSLTAVAQDIITGIGSCVTTTGDGATLTYSLMVTNVTLLNVGDSATVNVTLTLTDAIF